MSSCCIRILHADASAAGSKTGGARGIANEGEKGYSD
jgi:hypothetical protein